MCNYLNFLSCKLSHYKFILSSHTGASWYFRVHYLPRKSLAHSHAIYSAVLCNELIWVKLSCSLYHNTVKAASSSPTSWLAGPHIQFLSFIAAWCSGLHRNMCIGLTSLGLWRTKTNLTVGFQSFARLGNICMYNCLYCPCWSYLAFITAQAQTRLLSCSLPPSPRRKFCSIDSTWFKSKKIFPIDTLGGRGYLFKGHYLEQIQTLRQVMHVLHPWCFCCWKMMSN